jgi:dihydroxy-acid dehydratase
MAIMGELERKNLIDTSVGRVDYPTLHDAIADWDIMSGTTLDEAFDLFRSAPAEKKSLEMGSQDTLYEELDTDRERGCIRSLEHPYSKDGGLAVLYGNIADNGCIIKTAGVEPGSFSFSGPAVVFESQEEAVEGILGGKVREGNAVIIRYEGPKGGPGMQEMLYPTSYLKSIGLGKKCALITDGRFSGGTSGLSIGHVSPEAAAKGNIALIRTGDIIEINISQRKINVRLTEKELNKRFKEEEKKGKLAFKPEKRDREIPASLRAYASTVSSADKGAVRVIKD